MGDRVNFTHTTESLDAVIEILRNSRGPTLAITGSGDVSFANSEFGEPTLSVDHSTAQTQYARLRAKLLETGDFNWFLFGVPFEDYEWALGRRDAYFLDHGRLARIAKNAGSISFEENDLFEAAKKNPGQFANIYASNVFGYSKMHPKFYLERLEALADALVPSGLLYLADQGDIRLRASRKSVKGFIPESLRQDKELTLRAREIENPKVWTPIVYRKV